MEESLEQIARRMVREIEADLPAPASAYGEAADVRVAMRDGIALMTHVWLPQGDGPWPIILIRSPYVDGYDVGAQIYRLFVRHGYAVAYQECRGRGASGGEWVPFANERNDGLDTLAWLVRQPWSDGNIGLFGGSYLSFVQLAMADALPPQVKTMYLMVYGADQYGLTYMNGMFKHEVFTAWLMTNAGVAPAEAPEELNRRALRIMPHLDVDRRLFGRELPWYRDWVTQTGAGDPLWRGELWGRLADVPARIAVPVHMTAGWYDIALEPMFALYAGLKDEIKRQSRFVVGPWDHEMAPSGDLDYPGNRIMGAGQMRSALEWFDAKLRGKPYAHRSGIVKTYTIGANTWTTRADWPPPSEPLLYYLHAAPELAYAGGKLAALPPLAAGAATFRYDPADPVPTCGGGVLLPSLQPVAGKPVPGSVRQPEPGFHDGVLTFMSAPLADDLPIEGSVKVALRVSSDADDTAFAVKLMELFAEGEAYNIVDGIASLAYRNGADTPLPYEGGEIVTLAIELWPIAWRMRRGSRIRLDVSSSNYPAYHAHPNVAGAWAEQTKTRIARQTVYCDVDGQSFLQLPVVALEEELSQ